MARMVLVITFQHDNSVVQNNSDAKEKPLALAAPLLIGRETTEQRVIFTPPAEVNSCHCPSFHPLPYMKARHKSQSCLLEMSILILFSSTVYPIFINVQIFRKKKAVMDDQKEAGESTSRRNGVCCGFPVCSGKQDMGRQAKNEHSYTK